MKRCARCGVRLRDLRIYSRWTHSYYCVDDKACGKRARRRQRAQVSR
jgi:hypothetical protein